MYPSRIGDHMSFQRIIDSPLPWALSGFIVGLALGVTTISAWLLAIGLGVFIVYLWRHGPAQHATEGWLFAAGPALVVSWVVGFIVHGLAF